MRGIVRYKVAARRNHCLCRFIDDLFKTFCYCGRRYGKNVSYHTIPVRWLFILFLSFFLFVFVFAVVVDAAAAALSVWSSSALNEASSHGSGEGSEQG